MENLMNEENEWIIENRLEFKKDQQTASVLMKLLQH